MDLDAGRVRGGPDPPRLWPAALLRTRLLERLDARWLAPLTVVTAGPGFGKTTLLVHAVGENERAPRGTDHWVSCRPHHTIAAQFGADVLRSLGASLPHDGATEATAAHVVDAMRSRAPTHCCLVLDDVHLIPAGTSGAALLDEIVDSLPLNGHLLLAGRRDPPVGLARRRTLGVVHEVAERDLLLDDEEVHAFATLRLVPASRLADAAGWPAMAELLARSQPSTASDFLWEEVLRELPEERREALAMVHALGGGDDEVLGAALGRDVDVRQVTRSIPLTSVTDGGYATVHDLWAPALERVLPRSTRAAGCRRAADVARRRGRLTEAVRLYDVADASDEIRAVVRDVCSESHPREPTGVLADWRNRLVARRLHDCGELALLEGAIRKPVDPLGAVPFFEQAVARFAAAGERDGEAAALFHLGHIAWWHEDHVLLASLFERAIELGAQGSALARSIETLGPLVLCEVIGDADGVIDAAHRSTREHQHPEIVPLTDYLEARAHLAVGDPERGLHAATRACAAATATMRPPAEFERLSCLWALGHRQKTLAQLAVAHAELESVSWVHNRSANGAQAALWSCIDGRRDDAERYLRSAVEVRDASGAWAHALVALAEAMMAIEDGDEPRAADALRAELAARPLTDPAVLRSHRAWLPITYVLVPETRAVWDAADLRGTVAAGRAAARAIVAVREGADEFALTGADVDRARPQLPRPWWVELAIAREAAGPRGAGRDVLGEATHPRTRSRLVELAAAGAHRTTAQALLQQHAVVPPRTLTLRTLGAFAIEGPPDAVTAARFGRRAVRELLLALVELGPLPRSRICALLWPDLDASAARNNLRVTLSHLVSGLQPTRDGSEPSAYVEDRDDLLRVRVESFALVDVVAFDEAVERAAAAARRRDVAAEYDAHRIACALYRGDHLTGLEDVEWTYAPRERRRLAFVGAAVRAGELAVADRQGDVATDLALRAITADRWSEPARRLLAESRLALGDRSGARRALADCDEILRELGVEPEPATRMLALRVGLSVGTP